ncbi:MAG TPA: serine/threonine-protein kinase [Vicinamibacterales bacterium]|nr:serine/threonine-protein kinase [Vicinamibacterales bacterium]
MAAASARMKSPPQSEWAAWARCGAPRIPTLVARSRSRFCQTRSRTDADRLARLEREAKTLASLNHANIAIIHGLEKGDGVRALVMEFVEGPTLADRIGQGPIALDEALPIAQQIARALEAAHEQGIIHRDLKPANIKVRADGTVKVLDFGLAKAMEPVGAMSPSHSQSATITTPAMTQAGLILGTAAYMSPEQARGKALDKRADIWSFGCVLFELLTGRRAFGGDDIATRWHSSSRRSRSGRRSRWTCPQRFASCCAGVWRRITTGASLISPTCGSKSKMR